MKKCPNAPERHDNFLRPAWERLRQRVKRESVAFYTPDDVAEIQSKETLERVLYFFNRISTFVDDVEETYVCIMRICLFKRIMEL